MCYVDLTALHTYHYYFKYLFNMKTVWASLVTEKVKNLLATQETGLIPGEGNSYPLLFLPENSMTEESGGLQSRMDCKELDMTEQLTFSHFQLKLAHL